MANGADGREGGPLGPGGRRIIAGLTLAVNSILALATLLAAPAPEAVGLWELVLAGGLLAAVVLLGVAAWGRWFRLLDREQLFPLLILAAFGLPVAVSALLGAARGVAGGAVLRATLPYAAFLPVMLLGLLAGERRLRLVTAPLVFAGLIQSGYLLWLFLTRVPDPTDVGSVWIWRTTLIDPRTTLPLLLATAALPLAWRPASRLGQVGRAMVVALPVAAAVSTQTRSQVLAVLLTVVAGLALLRVRRLRVGGAAWHVTALRGLVAALPAVLVAAAALLAIPQTRALLGAVALRTQSDLDTGRLEDEWIPALQAVAGEGVAGAALGIGAGETFITAGGETRSYVHNLLLYGLVYFGAPGLACLLVGYLLLVAGLLRRGARTEDERYYALAAMVAGMFLYAQFFAVHKLFSYNLMLALCGQALAQSPGSPRTSS